jgi:pimeloyl-ACP methyl ester carboxylesterase/DNA-binding CsgD family transcriptional regulator
MSRRQRSDVQAVRYIRTADGIALAWARSGEGLPLVKAANWLTHLEYDAESPIWSHWTGFLESNFDFVRYDERGCGMSDRSPGKLGVESWLADLEAVTAASGIAPPFALLGVSHGTAAALAFAEKHPELVSHLILYGGYARGVFRRGDEAAADLYRAVVEILRLGLNASNPAFQEVFTSRFIPDAGPEELGWFNELCRRTISPEAGAKLLLARGEIDVTGLLDRITVPTLVVHARDDAITPMSEGEILARNISRARFAVIEGRNHILQAREPGWRAFQELVLDFTGTASAIGLSDLTEREIEILRLICRARSNKQIARDLGLSEKTVRNHASKLFAKLGVNSRQEAMVAAARHFS